MSKLDFKVFEFSPFAENTYVFWDTQSLEAWIVDPGCYELSEKQKLERFIQEKGLKPVKLINTHCHLDHVFGNRYVFERYGLLPECHEGELTVLKRMPEVCAMYGIPNAEPSPVPEKFISAGEILHLGSTAFSVLFTPGHSPASLCFFAPDEELLIGGDVLFFESIGRTDLPGGHHETLISSIKTELFALPESTVVLPGHGPSTTIRHEKAYNPFL
jgi:hydroxyacylglutathione hydrolase